MANTYLAVDAGLELIPALNKIDLPGAEPERVAGEIARAAGRSARRGDPHVGQDRRGHHRGARGDRLAHPSARGGPRGPGARADLRLRVRPVPGRGGLPARGGRRTAKGRRDPGHAGRHPGRHRRHRLLRTPDDSARRAARGRGGVRDHRDQGRLPAAGGRHDHHPRDACLRAAARLPGGQADGVLRPVPGGHRPLLRPPRRAREAGAERRRAVL